MKRGFLLKKCFNAPSSSVSTFLVEKQSGHLCMEPMEKSLDQKRLTCTCQSPLAVLPEEILNLLQSFLELKRFDETTFKPCCHLNFSNFISGICSAGISPLREAIVEELSRLEAVRGQVWAS